MTSPSVALFTKTFLEPTHHAIAAVLERLPSVTYHVFAKRFEPCEGYELRNVVSRTDFSSIQVPEGALKGVNLVHAVFDGDIALRAAGIAAGSRLPLIISFHGGFDTKAKIADPLYRELTAQAATNARTVTVVSKGDAARLRAIGVTREVEVVPVPVDLSMIRPAHRVPGQLLAIGRLVEKKGFDVAIAALTHLPEKYRLRIVGDGPYRRAWQELANRVGVSARVTWLGSVPLRQCLEELHSAWALVHPARVAADGNTEGVPQAILWAQAAGVPVVTTSVGDITEVVRHQETGLLADATPAAIAAAIASLEDGRSKSGTTGRNHISAHSLDNVAARWAWLYAEALR